VTQRVQIQLVAIPLLDDNLRQVVQLTKQYNLLPIT